jgi:guanylate kinase
MQELRKRITTRGSESDEAIDLRMNETLKEISYIDKYDYCVVNGVLEEAVNRVSAIMIAEHSKVGVNIETLMERYRQEGAKG